MEPENPTDDLPEYLPEYLNVNRDLWDSDATNWVASGERAWAQDAPSWGNWAMPDSKLGLMPVDLTGCDCVELGCGTGYVSGWMTRRGGRVTAIDISAAQLATARRLAAQHGADITFVQGNAEATGLPDASFDFAISEYGAAIWCRPETWLAEARRLLRPGGRLVFLGNHPLSLICAPLDGAPCDDRLHRPYRDMWGADWTGVEIEPSGICFNLTLADWFALFNTLGFAVRNNTNFTPRPKPPTPAARSPPPGRGTIPSNRPGSWKNAPDAGRRWRKVCLSERWDFFGSGEMGAVLPAGAKKY